MRISYIVLLSLSVLTSCGVGKKLPTKTVDVEKLGTNPEGILFLTVMFRKTEKGCEAYDMKARWTNGFLKQMVDGEGDFSCVVEDINESIEINFENPLSTSFEEYGDDGEMKRVEVVTKEAEHTFRLNYGGGERLIKIIDRQNQEVIGQFKIQ